MAVTVIAPLTRERMIEILARQLVVGGQQCDHFHKQTIQDLAVPPCLFPLIVPLETAGI